MAYFNKDYIIMLYEIPMQSYNTIFGKSMLLDEALKPPKEHKVINKKLFDQIQVEIINHHSVNQAITDKFKEKICSAVKDVQ